MWEEGGRRRARKEDAEAAARRFDQALTFQECGFRVAASPRKAVDFGMQTKAI